MSSAEHLCTVKLPYFLDIPHQIFGLRDQWYSIVKLLDNVFLYHKSLRPIYCPYIGSQDELVLSLGKLHLHLLNFLLLIQKWTFRLSH